MFKCHAPVPKKLGEAMVIIIIIIIYLSHTDAASINFRIAVVILGTWRKKMWQRLIDWLIQCCESRFPTRIRPQNYAKTVIKTKKYNLSYVKMRTFFVKISSYLFVWFSSQVQVRFLKFVQKTDHLLLFAARSNS